MSRLMKYRLTLDFCRFKCTRSVLECFRSVLWPKWKHRDQAETSNYHPFHKLMAPRPSSITDYRWRKWAIFTSDERVESSRVELVGKRKRCIISEEYRKKLLDKCIIKSIVEPLKPGEVGKPSSSEALQNEKMFSPEFNLKITLRRSRYFFIPELLAKKRLSTWSRRNFAETTRSSKAISHE